MIKKNTLDMIGNTDLLLLSNLSKKYSNNIYVKIEGNNPFGSIKDRVAKEIIEQGLKDGLIDNDTVVIEATSGNTGIGLAGICKLKGLKFIVVMPENMSVERINLMKVYGATVYLTDASLGMSGSIIKAEELKKTYPKTFMPKQFENENNYLAHYKTTAVEIDNDLKDIEGIFAGIGTGGTISGIGMYFKEKGLNTKVIGIEPYESPFITKHEKGKHGIQGIGAGFIPEIYLNKYVDNVVTVKTSDAYSRCKELLEEEALFLGISSGASFDGLIQYIKENNIKNKNLVFISPDSGMKYMSSFLGSEDK